MPAGEPVLEGNPDPASSQAGGSDSAAPVPEVNPDPASSQAGGSDGAGIPKGNPDPASSQAGGSDGGAAGEWQDIILDEEFNFHHGDKGRFFITERSGSMWRGFGFAMVDEFRRFYSFEADVDEILPVEFFDGKHPVVLRKAGCVHQIKLLKDEPEYELQEGERFPVVFQNYRFWHENENDRLRDHVYGERRYADEVHLTTYGGGPYGGYIINTEPSTGGGWRSAARCSTLISRKTSA